MRTFRYKLQNHKRNRHIQKDIYIMAEVYNHFVALTRRHYKIYGKCKGYKRVSYTRMSAHLTKLKKLPKHSHWHTPYSWALQESLKRLWGRKISDLAFGEFTQKIEWQAVKRDKEVKTIGRFEATTPICHKCGQRTDIELKVREWMCHNCNTTHDRDVNAAVNIAQVGASTCSVGNVSLAIASYS